MKEVDHAGELQAHRVDRRAKLTSAWMRPNWGLPRPMSSIPLDEIVGQPRAMRALDLGLGIRHSTYHIYVAGMHGTGKMETIRRALAERVSQEPTPDDWVILNNFTTPDHPLAIPLTAGQGLQLKRDLGPSRRPAARKSCPRPFAVRSTTRSRTVCAASTSEWPKRPSGNWRRSPRRWHWLPSGSPTGSWCFCQ